MRQSALSVRIVSLTISAGLEAGAYQFGSLHQSKNGSAESWVY
jgi:hypothetical protein